jgi:hypothetical protein
VTNECEEPETINASAPARVPSRRSSPRTLAGTIDESAERFFALRARVDRLKKRAERILAERKRLEAESEELRELYREALERHGLEVLEGERYRVRRGEGRPSFSAADLERIGHPFIELRARLVDAECLAAYRRGDLPAEIVVKRSPWVLFEER